MKMEAVCWGGDVLAAFAAARLVGPGFWRSQMTLGSRSLSPARAEDPDEVATLQTLGIFCGAGLLLSLLLAMSGLM